MAAMAACAYAAVIAVVRLPGKRTLAKHTLAKMNAFDLVVTVALGSTSATILLTSTVSLAEGPSLWPSWWPCSSSTPGSRWAPVGFGG
ncbi:hypothetical protein [Streptomyces macrosporus]|uniref:hypothetical protein n=1 Tax=Streptomyces macrosporus TaxID=44032 RepID=UPI0031D4A3E6